MLGKVFRGKLLAALGSHRDGGGFPEWKGTAYARLVASVKDKDWEPIPVGTADGMPQG
jgi:hypothetical protein